MKLLVKDPPDPWVSADPDRICGSPWGANERNRRTVCYFGPGVNRGGGRGSLWSSPPSRHSDHSECLLGGHRSIVPAARPETHPLLPWRWMSRLWCQAIHKLFHTGDRKIHFFLIPTPCACVISTRSTLTDGQQVKVVNGPLALVYLSDLS